MLEWLNETPMFTAKNSVLSVFVSEDTITFLADFE